MFGSFELVQVAFGVDQVGGGVAAVDPGERRRCGAPSCDDRGDVEVPVAQLANRLVNARERGLEVLSATPCGPERSQRSGAESGGGGTVAGGVRDREPRPVAVLDEIEPVAADLVRGKQGAG